MAAFTRTLPLTGFTLPFSSQMHIKTCIFGQIHTHTYVHFLHPPTPTPKHTHCFLSQHFSRPAHCIPRYAAGFIATKCCIYFGLDSQRGRRRAVVAQVRSLRVGQDKKGGECACAAVRALKKAALVPSLGISTVILAYAGFCSLVLNVSVAQLFVNQDQWHAYNLIEILY